MIRVILVDDHRRIHEMVALALKNSAEILLVGDASNGDEALLLCSQFSGVRPSDTTASTHTSLLQPLALS